MTAGFGKVDPAFLCLPQFLQRRRHRRFEQWQLFGNRVPDDLEINAVD